MIRHACIFLVIALTPSVAWATQADCRYVAGGAAPTLVRGAHGQTVWLHSPASSCETSFPQQFDTGSDEVILKTDGDNAVTLSAEFLTDPSGAASLRFDQIPSDIAEKTYDFTILRAGNNAQLGRISLQVGSVTVRPTLRITYEDAGLDELQDGNSYSGTDGPIAVAGHKATGGEIVNAASLQIPESLPAASDDINYWEIDHASWKAISFTDTTNVSGFGARMEIGRPGTISFATTKRQVTPLRVTLRLRQRSAATGASATSDPIWFEVDLLLAAEARFESLPMPIANVTYVLCGDGSTLRMRMKASGAVLQQGEKAIDGDDLANGHCQVGLDFQGKTQFALYGPQTLKVTISREGAKERTLIWTASGDGSSMPLSPPDDDQKGSGPYRIEVTVSRVAKQAVYRTGARDSLDQLTDANEVAPDYRFSAILRPRGEHATGSWLRMFVTIPLDLLSVRMPASVRDLDNSRDNRYVQLLTLRTGIQLAVEPWDYDHGRNRLAVPMRLVGGLSFFDLSDAKFSPSVDVGVEVVLGTLGGGTIPTSVTLGFLYENDLREPAEGSRFLFTSSINFLSLFGAQSGEKK